MTTLFPATTFKADVTVGASQTDGMIWIPGGTFRMGSDKHYPEEAPAHRVTVDGFWMDRYPGDEPAIQGIRKGHQTRHRRRDHARPEGLSRNAPAHGLRGLADVLAAQPSGQSPRLQPVVDLRQGRAMAASLRTRKQHPWAGRSSGRACGLQRCARLREMGWQGFADRSGMGICSAWRARRRRVCVGR